MVDFAALLHRVHILVASLQGGGKRGGRRRLGGTGSRNALGARRLREASIGARATSDRLEGSSIGFIGLALSAGESSGGTPRAIGAASARDFRSDRAAEGAERLFGVGLGKRRVGLKRVARGVALGMRLTHH